MIDLSNKVAVITGGARGIGKETAKKFIEAGAQVAIWDIDEENGKQCVQDLGEDNAHFFKVNTSSLAETNRAAHNTFNKFNRIDFLINNAGITRDSSFKKMTSEQWDQVISVNLTGVFNVTKSIYPYMAEAGFGRIINASSVVAHNGNFGQTNYVATKAGVIGMTKTWSREFGRKGINVNAVAPGFIRTDMIKTIPSHIIEDLESKIPKGRLGETEDIANAYLFLCSDLANYINGAVLNVDGGLIF